ncbi:MAG: hypothetical protein Q9195_000966 [Heterodermia aff. obscurata]
MASASNNSSIAFAFAGKTDSVNIPKPRDASFWAGRNSFAAVAARPAPTSKQASALPTPPNSISPTLPPQGFKFNPPAGPPTPPAVATVDSDIDLQDAVDHAQAQDQSQHGLATIRGSLADIDAAGAITPALLAKHHLPNILLVNGPLAIRHVMGYLTASVPGFSGIPPAKARRLVVGALEGRGSGGEHEGFDSDVVFEKVGWGKWGARRRGQPARSTENDGSRPGRHPSPKFPGGLEIPGNSSREDHIRDIGTRMGADPDSEIEYDTPPEDISMLEHEADKMSLDGVDSCSSSDIQEYDLATGHGFDDVTDEEDWASIGAAALRQGSFPLRSGPGRPQTKRPYPPHLDLKTRGRGADPPSLRLAKSMPTPQKAVVYQTTQHQPLAAGYPTDGDAEQRAAVEALLKLASV